MSLETPLPDASPALVQGARELLAQAGLGEPGAIAACGQGRNNRAYRVETARGPALLKEYFRHPHDPRARLDAESAFLRFCARHGVKRVPALLAENPARGLALHSWIAGAAWIGPDPISLTQADIAEAGAFFADLIRASAKADPDFILDRASEACLDLAEHLEAPARRLAGLAQILRADDADPNPAYAAARRDALRFLETELVPAWEGLRRATRAAWKSRTWIEVVYPAMISPSDFGFHNALRVPPEPHGSDARVFFLDFEYAGWDDPAKALADFQCQPAVPVPEGAWETLADAAVRARPENATLFEEAVERCRVLLPVHRLKWCCIMLNVFRPTDAARRGFARAASSPDHAAAQLARAREYWDARPDARA